MNRLSAISRRVLLAVIALTVLGFALRLARYQQSLFGDETSTLYLVRGRGFMEVLSLVSSDKEITPPLYFLLAWLTTQLGSAAELIRLPSLIAGTAVIPLSYVVGYRTMGRAAGLIAATIVTLAPTLIFVSGDGRAYAVTILMLVGSTAALLAAVRTRHTRWWVAYGALSCLAMYGHYTAAFVLVGQLGWLLWAHPQARRAALLANVAAAVLYLPWIPWLLADFDSPTVDILSALQGTGFAAKRYAVEVWAIGYPFKSPHDVPGVFAAVLGLAGFLVAVMAGLIRRLRMPRRGDEQRRAFDRGLVLALALLLSAPVLELLMLALTGNDLFGARNLNVASVGLALTIAGLVVAAGRIWGGIALIGILICFAVGAVGALEANSRLPDTKGAVALANERAENGAVLLDLYTSPLVNPVPVSALSAYADTSAVTVVSPFLPTSPPPFLLTPSQSEIDSTVRNVFSDSAGGDVYILGSPGRVVAEDGSVSVKTDPPSLNNQPSEAIGVVAPEGSKIVDISTLLGVDELQLTVVHVPERSGLSTRDNPEAR